jgi:hypothetical protein
MALFVGRREFLDREIRHTCKDHEQVNFDDFGELVFN